MIVYDLQCEDARHRFEGWFKSSDEYERQAGRGLLSCPQCGSANVAKALQAPRLSRKGNQIAAEGRQPPAPRPEAPAAPGPEAAAAIARIAQLQAELLKTSRYVGDTFAEDARAMHYGERPAEQIHGHTTIGEARELIDEGVALLPLPMPVAPPEKVN